MSAMRSSRSFQRVRDHIRWAGLKVDWGDLPERNERALRDAQLEREQTAGKANLQVAESNVIVQQASIDRAQANLRKAQLEYERAALRPA